MISIVCDSSVDAAEGNSVLVWADAKASKQSESSFFIFDSP
jgi:hypothetical protein